MTSTEAKGGVLPKTMREIHKLALDQRGRPVKSLRVVIGPHGREIARV